MPMHVVKQGECFFSLAEVYSNRLETDLYNHPQGTRP